MLAGIAGFEWRYATRRITFAAAAAVFALLGFTLANTEFGASDIHVNAPYAVAYSIAFLSLTAVFALTVIVAPTLLRDTEHQMAEIVYSTAVTKSQYLLGRLAGSFAAAATAFLFGIAGMIAGALSHQEERLASFDPWSYLTALAIFGLPSMAFVAALLFAIAAATRSTLATYIGGIVLYVLYFAAAVVAGSPLLAASGPVSAQEMAVAALVDPFGLSAIFEQTHYWTAAERDTRRLALRGSLLANRMLWGAATVALVLLAHRLFAFRVSVPRRRGDDGEGGAPSAAPYRPVTVSPSTTAAALFSSVALEVRALLRSWPFLALLILWAGTAFMTVLEELRRAEYGTALHPTAGLIVGHLGQPLLLFGVLVIVYFAGEVVWRERTVRVAEIVDATPASSTIFMVSKTAALWLLIAVLIAVGIAAGMVLQIASGHRPMEPVVFASLFYLGGVPLALFAVLAVLLQTLAPNRNAGLLLALVAAVFLPLGGPGGPQHPLLRYGHAGTVPYSGMNGFGPALGVFTSLAVYWAAGAGLLAIAAIGSWRRGTDAGLRRRLRGIARGLSVPARVTAAVCVLAWAVMGGVLFHQMNVVNAYVTPEDRARWREGYERAYAGWGRLPQPVIAHLHAEVDLFPEERRYRTRGRYRLLNTTALPVESVMVNVPSGVRAVMFSLDGRLPTSVDERFRVRTFAARMPPGGQAELAFEIEVDRRAAAADVANDIVANGTFIFGPSVLPALGYRHGYEIEDPGERRRRGLATRVPPPMRDPELATSEVVVTGPTDQTVVAPGTTRGTGEKDGRRWTRFTVDRPSQPIVTIASARYAVARARVGGVDVEVMHHPGHDANVPRILEAAAWALEYCTREYGPYPYPVLRIAETPSYDDRFGGYAVPGAIYLTEDRAFLTDQRDARRVDIVTKRTAHEVAHQWWGHQVVPPSGPGASAVIETMARYVDLMALKHRHGTDALRRVLEVERGRYLAGRRGEAEMPLVAVEDQAYIYYAKGGLVMTALQGLIGETAVNGALRTVVARQRAGGPSATAVALLDALRAATPASRRSLLDEWWTRVVLDDFRVLSAKATRRPDGRVRVDARVEASKSEVGSAGGTALPVDDDVEIAIYAEHPDGTAAPPLSVTTHRLRAATDVSIVVEGKPGYIVVDPWLRRIDRSPDDNVRRIEPAE